MQPLRHSYTNHTLGDGATVVKYYQGPDALARSEHEHAALRALQGRVDYRFWSGQVNGTTITFGFEVSKYYDDGKSFLNLSTQDFELLVNEGLARNFWIAGISKLITIPAN
jgi:hypothetical protein